MDPASVVAIVVAVVGGLFGAGGIAAIRKTRSENKKIEADAEITLTGGWRILYETTRLEARAEINELRERLAIVEANERKCNERLAKIESTGGADIEKTVAGLIGRHIEKMGGAPSEPVTTRDHGQ